MGTGFDINTTEEQVGIIPRAVAHLFEGIQRLKQHSHDNSLPEPTFQVLAQFMELYNEDIYDLFDPSSVPQEGGKKSKSNIKIHEDANGSIYTQGVASKQVLSYDEVSAQLLYEKSVLKPCGSNDTLFRYISLHL